MNCIETLRNTISLICLAALVAGCTRETTNDTIAPAAFYTVNHYDENRDPFADLAATIKRADSEGKRILLQIGGDWCGWCARISNYMETEERIRIMLDESFVVMKVTFPSENTEFFLSQYPNIDAYPHLFVLEKDGAFLHSQGTGELEEEGSYNQDVFAKFLSSWIP